jgi:hypothetical protein
VTDLRVLVRCALIWRTGALVSKHIEVVRAELAAVQDNPAAWHDPIKFEISYACYISLKHGAHTPTSRSPRAAPPPFLLSGSTCTPTRP